MKGRSIFAVYLLLAFAAVCFISVPAFADNPFDVDLDEPNTGGSLLRGNDEAVGAGLTQSSSGWVPPPQGGIAYMFYSWASDYFNMHLRTIQQGTHTRIESFERERRLADRLLIRHFR